ncbi:DIP1984 family protein [Xanthomarina sp. F1114]|uniref:DIP1984 family protein n=1 Tax=Xanthomarina sp. F1114 TaxID=2996019 RepID=UPI00225E3711|nr:DIP1984 family protein [Xanthomarina sp. F1114]MCX7548940.1 DIP1984 family protein [Xanthomarina sp. F1114]
MEDENKKMKLAEALLLRADLMKKIEHLQNRIRPVLIVSDNKKPQEDPAKLLAQMRTTIQDLETLVIRINKTNNETQIKGEGSLMEALAKRDSLKMLSEKLRNIRYAAQINNSGDANLKTTIDIKKLQIEMDQTGRAFRELDSKIQELNWLTELKD